MRETREFPDAMNVQAPPPREWINGTLRFDKPERLSAILPTVIAGMNPPVDIVAELPEFGVFLGVTKGRGDAVLAERILCNAPYCFYGDNALNRYAHGAWALVVLGRDQEAWDLIKNVGPVCKRMRMPRGVLLMYIFLALRHRNANSAMKGLHAFVKWHRNCDKADIAALNQAYKWLMQDIAAALASD